MKIPASLRRIAALTKKEFLQLARDKSSMMIGAVLPLVLIVLIGCGISLDVKNVPVAVVLQDASPTAYSVLGFLEGSEYFSPIWTESMRDAENLVTSRQADAIINVPPDFTSRLHSGRASLQLILYGTDSATASAVQGYVEAAVGQWRSQNAAAYTGGKSAGGVAVVSRIWFNDANSSTWYFVPGLIMLIMTLVGVFLTALVMAREWERGTLEAMFVSPVRPAELLISKMIPYFCVAMLGFSLCLCAARFFYGVPIRAPLALIALSSMLYLFAALGIGLLISAVTKNQFLASQVSLIVSFLPAVMLSGFIYDLRCVPLWINIIGEVMPPTFYLQLLKSLMLTGNNWPLLFRNCFVLLLFACFFMGAALLFTKKRVE